MLQRCVEKAYAILKPELTPASQTYVDCGAGVLVDSSTAHLKRVHCELSGRLHVCWESCLVSGVCCCCLHGLPVGKSGTGFSVHTPAVTGD